MGNLKEQVAYLQGLTKGLNLTDSSAEGKMLLKIVDVLDDFAEELQYIHAAQEELETYVETIDEDLTDLEEDIYENTEEEYAIAEEHTEEDMVEVACPV